MGIDGLTSYLRKRNAYKVCSYPVSTLEGKHIVVDASGFIHRYFRAVLYDVLYNDDIHGDMDMQGIVDFEIAANSKSIMNNIAKGLDKFAGAKVTFIFDGQGPTDRFDALGGKFDYLDKVRSLVTAIKDATLERRKETMRKAYDKMRSKGGTIATLFRITPTVQEMVQQALCDYGFSYVYAGVEADWLCSLYVKTGKAWAVVGRDLDYMVYGVERQIINNDRETFEIYDLPEIRKALGVTQHQLRDMCILMGCDYNRRIRLIGPARCHQIVTGKRKWPEAEKLESCTKLDPMRKIFSSVDHEFDYVSF